MADKRCAVFIVQGSKTGTGRPEQPLLFFSLIHITHHIIHTHKRSREERKIGKGIEKARDHRKKSKVPIPVSAGKRLGMHMLDKKYEIKEQFLFHTMHHVLSSKPLCMIRL